MKFKSQLIILLIISIITRLWNIGEFNQLVFDEAHYVKFADHYIRNKDFFQVHPPVAQYLTAISIIVGKMLPFPHDTNYVNNDAGFSYNVLTYRWLNGIIGSLLPIVASLLIYEIKPITKIGTLTGIFIIIDGLFITESRYALNNIYLVFFGILSQWLIIKSIKRRNRIMSFLGSVTLGLSIGTKISGLGYLGGTWIYLRMSELKEKISNEELLNKLILVPALTYLALWIPHQLMVDSSDFIQTHILSLKFHKEAEEINHPSNSKWYQWPLLFRPITFVNQQFSGVYRYVLSLPNPVVGYGSTIAMITLAGRRFLMEIDKSYNEIIIFCLINYGTNWLPWAIVSRGIFLYHYMPAYIYAMMALATILNIIDKKIPKASIVFTTIAVISFLFYKSIYYGIPMTYDELLKMMLFTKWI